MDEPIDYNALRKFVHGYLNPDGDDFAAAERAEAICRIITFHERGCRQEFTCGVVDGWRKDQPKENPCANPH